jgi:chaperone modulatory protein CbpM
MIRFEAVIALFPELRPPQLRDWVARGWVRAEGATPEEWMFADSAIARIHLIRDLRIDMAVDEEALPVVLSLVDQVHGMRRTLQALRRALAEQPEDVRRSLLDALTRQH